MFAIKCGRNNKSSEKALELKGEWMSESDYVEEEACLESLKFLTANDRREAYKIFISYEKKKKERNDLDM